MSRSRSIRFTTPASEWTDALPIGNGFAGAMLFAGIRRERIQLNEGSAWSGSVQSELAGSRATAVDAAESIASARLAIENEDYAAADAALRQLQHRYSQTFLPFVDLIIDLEVSGTPIEFERSLDLATATHTSSVRFEDFELQRTSFASHPDHVIVHRIRAVEGRLPVVRAHLESLLKVVGSEASTNRLDMKLRLPTDVTPSHDSYDPPVVYSDGPGEALDAAAVVRVEHDGTSVCVDGEIRVSDARWVDFVIATATTFDGIAREPRGDVETAHRRAIQQAADAIARIEVLHDSHVADVGPLLGRAEIELGSSLDVEMNERLHAARQDPRGVVAADPDLVGLLFDFGRYLLVSSSRQGGVPTTLQGLWNDSLQPPWSSNYTTNINVEMNYWLAEPTGLSDCLPPLFSLIDGLSRTGARTARELYAASGWAAHHNTDVWAYSLPVGMGEHDPKWAFWPHAGAWLVHHLWDRIRFGADDEFIMEYAWPLIRGATEFALSWLVDMGDGTFGTTPSTSPENQFRAPDGTVSSSARSSAADRLLLGDVLEFAIAIGDRLSLEDDVVEQARKVRPLIPGPIIGSDGLVQEWFDAFDMPDPTHRHLSHLMFVHPGERPLSRSLSTAARRSLDSRGDDATGWSLAWKMMMRARLGDSSRIGDLANLFFRDMNVDRGEWIGGLYPNLFSAHPPFQIDGNLGFTAAVAESLLQSHRQEIHLLPALPSEYGPGKVRGLIARPGVEVAIRWDVEHGKIQLLEASLKALNAQAKGRRRVRFANQVIDVDLSHELLHVDVTSLVNDQVMVA